MISLAFGEDGKGDDYAAYARAMTLCKQLESELADMRTIFVSYILSEEAWRESKKDPIPMLIEANFMKEKAKEVLGL